MIQSALPATAIPANTDIWRVRLFASERLIIGKTESQRGQKLDEKSKLMNFKALQKF